MDVYRVRDKITGEVGYISFEYKIQPVPLSGDAVVKDSFEIPDNLEFIGEGNPLTEEEKELLAKK